MNDDEPIREDAGRIISATSPFYPEDPSAWASGEVLRLLLVPLLVTVLFVGGVYWIKWRLPSGRVEQEPASTVQVHLMARPGPEFVPVPAAEVSSTTSASIAARNETTIDPSDRPAEDATVEPVPPATATREIAVPVSPVAPAEGPPSAAATMFRQALLRHVARYQRYPKTVRRDRLYGSVDMMFSMRRDGTIVGVWVRSSSGQAIFDKEAVDTIWRAQPLPRIPSDLPDPLTVETTLVFEPS
jgi:periplasmic protein TonB